MKSKICFVVCGCLVLSSLPAACGGADIPSETDPWETADVPNTDGEMTAAAVLETVPETAPP